jgi:hypothetical protein
MTRVIVAPCYIGVYNISSISCVAAAIISKTDRRSWICNTALIVSPP